MKLKLKEELKKKEISQIKLAEHLKLAKSTISMYANNENEPNLDTLVKIADFLHISTDELLGRKTNNINLESLEPKTKELINKILSMNDTQIEQIISIINAINL